MIGKGVAYDSGALLLKNLVLLGDRRLRGS
jgi:hypothetical protein